MGHPVGVRLPCQESFRKGRAVVGESLRDARLAKGPSGASRATLYNQLADILREKIYSHEWGVRSRIPSEHELMDLFGVARGTVRRALKMLVDEGLLVQQHGRGTFVAEPGLSHPGGTRPFSFAASLAERGQSFVTRVVEKVLVPAPASVAYELEVEPGSTVMYLRRVRSVEGVPVVCQESWSPVVECPGIFEADFTRESMFDVVQRCSGKRIKYAHVRYSARVAGNAHSELLDCDEQAPLLVLEQVIRLESGTPIEWSSTWLSPGQSVEGDVVQPD